MINSPKSSAKIQKASKIPSLQLQNTTSPSLRPLISTSTSNPFTPSAAPWWPVRPSLSAPPRAARGDGSCSRVPRCCWWIRWRNRCLWPMAKVVVVGWVGGSTENESPTVINPSNRNHIPPPPRRHLQWHRWCHDLCPIARWAPSTKRTGDVIGKRFRWKNSTKMKGLVWKGNVDGSHFLW